MVRLIAFHITYRLLTCLPQLYVCRYIMHEPRTLPVPIASSQIHCYPLSIAGRSIPHASTRTGRCLWYVPDCFSSHLLTTHLSPATVCMWIPCAPRLFLPPHHRFVAVHYSSPAANRRFQLLSVCRHRAWDVLSIPSPFHPLAFPYTRLYLPVVYPIDVIYCQRVIYRDRLYKPIVFQRAVYTIVIHFEADRLLTNNAKVSLWAMPSYSPHIDHLSVNNQQTPQH